MYTKWETFVQPKYKDLKSEIMEYEYIENIKEVYESEIHKKAVAYHQTKR